MNKRFKKDEIQMYQTYIKNTFDREVKNIMTQAMIDDSVKHFRSYNTHTYSSFVQVVYFYSVGWEEAIMHEYLQSLYPIMRL